MRRVHNAHESEGIPMRKLLVPLLAVVALVAAGAAAGKTTTTVTISKTGYKPTAVSITTGDEVVFKNTDTVAHTVNFNRDNRDELQRHASACDSGGAERELHLPERRQVQVLGPGEQQEGVPRARSPCRRRSSRASRPRRRPSCTAPSRHSPASSPAGSRGSPSRSAQQMCGETKSTTVATVTTTAAGAFTLPGAAVKKTTYTLSNKGATASYRRRGRAEPACSARSGGTATA